MGKFVMTGKTALHYKDSEGCGRPVLLLHGYMESLDVWDDFSEILAKKGYRVVSLDLPGHGISEVLEEVHSMDLLAGVCEGLLIKLGIEEADIVGHSMGGYVALALAKNCPQRIRSLVLFSSTPNADTEEKKQNREREIEIVRSGRKEMLSGILPGKGFAPDNRKKLKDTIDELALQVMLTEDEGIVAILKGMMAREDMNGMLKELDKPQLFVFGGQDEYIPKEVAEKVAENNPQAKVAWLADSGHNGFLEQPEESAVILDEFFSEC
ncbi:MAG: alpha/beta hydrolase [Rikenellaceae bacterium]|nr:alpha/beta hydrolase [Rikenellaceae bacterium]